MKKVAPPPPPPGGAPSDQRPPLTNGDLRRQANHEAPPIIHHNNHNHLPAMSSTPGEDCAFDELLEGRMELEVVLPDNKTVHMIVDRRTPMMDLLVHAATANKISPGGHVIRVVPKLTRDHLQQQEEESHHQRDVPYKPNTPVGSLDVNTVHIVPKSHPDIPVRRMPKLANQPFEQTFRLQVNLPRNQRMVLRVSPRITLAELKRQICNEKELDHSSHHLVHPAQPDTVLDLNSSLELYGCAEISLMSNSGLRDSIRSTSTNFIGYSRVDDDKKKKGILRLFSKKKKETTVETNTNGLGSRGVSPTRNLSISNRDSYQPKQSTKRKPAPAPPPPVQTEPLVRTVLPVQTEPPPSPPLVIQSSSSINSRPESEVSAKTDELGSTVSHSRHSSDSSGYHEPSVFSDCSQENKSPEASIVQGGGGGGTTTTNVLLCTLPKDVVPPDSLPILSRQTTPIKEQQKSASLTNLKTVPCCSNTSIVSATRKRKAPQPPAPPVLQEVETPSSPEETSPLTTVKPVPETPTPVSSSVPEENPDEESVLEEESKDLNPQTLEVTSEEKEVITYLDYVLEESETVVSKSPARLSPTLDKQDDDDVIENVDTNVPPIDKLEDCHVVENNDDEIDSRVIETDAPSSPVLSLETPADDCNSYPDTSESPSVPLNKDILPQIDISESNVETSMQLSLQTNNFISDFNEESELKNQKEESKPLNSDSCEDKDFNNSVHISTQELCIDEPVKSENTPDLILTKDIENSSNSIVMDTRSISKTNTDSPKAHRKLLNFALGCYKNEDKDIYEETPSVESNKIKSSENTNFTKPELSKTDTLKYKRNTPDVKIVPFEDRSKTECTKGQVQLRRTELSEISTLPLTGRSSSLYNLTPQIKTVKDELKPMEPVSEGLKRTQSDQNLTQDPVEPEEKMDFIQEQKRLHEEYLKLQAQFISWQKQLLNNQSLLQNEQIVPQMTFPSLEQYKLQLENLPDILKLSSSNPNLESISNEEFKTQSLPRQMTTPLNVEKFHIPPSPVSPTSSPPKSLSSSEINSKESEQTQILKITNEPLSDPSVIYAQVNKQRKTSKSDSITSNTNASVEVNQDVKPDLPKKQQLVDEENSKSQTLPRNKTQPISAFDSSRTMTLNRQPRTKPQVVAVTIGSWQQRQQAETPDIYSANVASSRSMFQSLENIPKESSKPNAISPNRTEPKKSVNSPTESHTQPPVVTAKVIVKKDGKEIVEDQPEHRTAARSNSIQHKSTTKHSSKLESRPNVLENHTSYKPSKPLVHLTSMKDETRPPSIQVLKKWPLSDMNEKESAQKVAEQRSIWTELKASAMRPSGSSKERVTRAEVDLRKHRTQKNESSSKSPKGKEPETSKLHVSKVNINVENQTDSRKSSGSSSKQVTTPTEKPTEKQKFKPFPTSKSETFNAELKDVLFKRASSLVEQQDTELKLVESNYAELNGGNETSAKTVTVNGNSPLPPPPPPVSTMPTIPPAAPIPKSSQLLMNNKATKDSTKSKVKSSKTLPKVSPKKDPREELMLEIRSFGGRQALRKNPGTQTGWNLKVYGTATLQS